MPIDITGFVNQVAEKDQRIAALEAELAEAKADADCAKELRDNAETEMRKAHVYLQEALTRAEQAEAERDALRAEVERKTKALEELAAGHECGCTPICRCYDGERHRDYFDEVTKTASAALAPKSKPQSGEGEEA